MDYKIIILSPAKEFLESLEYKMQAKVIRTIELLQQFGPFLKEPHSKKIRGTDDLYELRIKQGSNISRFFYFHDSDILYVITSGYIKKDQKLKKAEIEKAIKLMNEYKEQ